MQKHGSNRVWLYIGIIASAPALLLMAALILVPPIGHVHDNSWPCRSNLMQIGGLLLARRASGDLEYVSGAAFLLQVKDRVKDKDLKLFVCPSDERAVQTAAGSDAPGFIDWYRQLNLPDGVDRSHCSYAGPDWRAFPPPPAAAEDDPGRPARLWACCLCPDHDGVLVMWETTKVELIPFEEIEGYDEDGDEVLIGPESPDPRLRTLCFW